MTESEYKVRIAELDADVHCLQIENKKAKEMIKTMITLLELFNSSNESVYNLIQKAKDFIKE